MCYGCLTGTKSDCSTLFTVQKAIITGYKSLYYSVNIIPDSLYYLFTPIQYIGIKKAIVVPSPTYDYPAIDILWLVLVFLPILEPDSCTKNVWDTNLLLRYPHFRVSWIFIIQEIMLDHLETFISDSI